ncbi:MAG: hypothetical protein LBL90_12890 [Prevotellaceae bacterium]|jgi:hypothetical protein|nr:hypothetical protein [Prevotellaceae bacterium]
MITTLTHVQKIELLRTALETSPQSMETIDKQLVKAAHECEFIDYAEYNYNSASDLILKLIPELPYFSPGRDGFYYHKDFRGPIATKTIEKLLEYYEDELEARYNDISSYN